MSTKDQILSAELHGEALLTARRPELQPLIDHLREVAQGRDDIRVECAGIIAGSWFAGAARRGEDLIAAGLLMLAGHVDLDELDKSVRIGWERRRGASNPLSGRRGLGPPLSEDGSRCVRLAGATKDMWEDVDAGLQDQLPDSDEPLAEADISANIFRANVNVNTAVQSALHDTTAQFDPP
jgi:hypothetical protein